MQIVSRQFQNAHKVFDDIDRCYAVTSERATQPLIPPVFDPSFTELFDVFDTYGDEKYAVSYKDAHYEPLDPNYNKNMILAFSGGKDSIVSALKFREAGYNVFLYHMKRVNRSFSDEWECAQSCAELLDMPIFFDEINYHGGTNIWMEHPMKNMVIANGALSYGIREGITTNIAFGNYTSSVLEDNPFERCAGDCMDMWEVYEIILNTVLPGFKIHCNVEHLGETLSVISNYPDLYAHSHSCLCRHSLRPYRNNWVLKRFGVQLPRIRCGSCYKCAAEYIYMADHGVLPYKEDYYKYCLDRLLHVLMSEHIYPFSVKDVWEHFMFYSMTESHLYDKFDSAVTLIGGIKWQE